MKTIFVNNYHFDDEYKNEIRNKIFECGDYQSINDISMDMIYNRMSEYDEDDLMYFKHVFNRLHKTYLLAGHVGTWRGNMKGGMIVNSFDDICDFLKDCMYYKIYEENGHVYVQGSHHDGDNFAELFEITEKGKEYMDRHYYDMYDYEIHNKILTSNGYSKLARLSKQIQY